MTRTDRQTGYSHEDAFFAEKDREILARKRAELDAARNQQQSSAASAEHWLKCPKCGGRMTETQLDVVLVDICDSCHGVYFDHGELGLLLEAKSGGLRKALSRLFG